MLVVDKITKKFPGVIALEEVSMTLQAGKVTALIGENGAGKSTLMKVLSGIYQDYEGDIVFKGKAVRFSNPKDAQAQGIAIIHQELNLIPYLSITENIFLGRELITQYGTLHKKKMKAATQELLDKLKLSVKPEELVANLKVGQQQVVEIAKALLTDSEVIIMDEPTSAITESEVEVLFGIIDDLRKQNKAIVYVSHKLDELFRIADHYVVLRDGRSIESGEMKDITQDMLINKMVGRSIQVQRKQAGDKKEEDLLTVKRLFLKHPVKLREDLLKNISFSVRKGEIVGIFGLMGAGRTELLETIFGLHPASSRSEICIEGERMIIHSPSDAIRAGLALVPEDRKRDGLVLGMDVKTNICLTTLADLEENGFLSSRKESLLSEKYMGELKIKASSPQQQAKNLSGGNQQKIVLAKWLATKPKLLLLDEPTRGIDIHAKSEIYKLILSLADAGLGVVFVSSELPEILAVADRILVMAEGVLTAGFSAEEATEDSILKAAIPKSVYENQL